MQNKIVIGIAVVVAVAIVGYFFVTKFMTQGMEQGATQQTASVPAGVDATSSAQEVTLPSGLIYRDEVVGTGAEAKTGSTVSVNYVGALTNGQVFDASSAHGGPFSFTIGSGQVIKGWDEGVAGMRVGGKRLMQIPATLAYGDRAMQGRDAEGKTVDVIPANSTLIFEVEVVDVK